MFTDAIFIKGIYFVSRGSRQAGVAPILNKGSSTGIIIFFSKITNIVVDKRLIFKQASFKKKIGPTSLTNHANILYNNNDASPISFESFHKVYFIIKEHVCMLHRYNEISL